MAKTSGGVRPQTVVRKVNKQSAYTGEQKSIIKGLNAEFVGIINKPANFSNPSTQYLKKLRKVAKEYKPSERANVLRLVRGAVVSGKRGSNLLGIRSEMTMVANRAYLAKNLRAIEDELRRRGN